MKDNKKIKKTYSCKYIQIVNRLAIKKKNYVVSVKVKRF